MRADITVITPSVPGRGDHLVRAMQSVQAQTLTPKAHVVRISEPPDGLSVAHLAQQRTLLLDAVDTEWTALLDDDDWWEPEHLEALVAQSADADIVFSWNERQQPSQVDDWRAAVRFGLVDYSALIRTSLARHLGGWRCASGCWEDWDFWLRALDAGARLTCVEKVTWHYGDTRPSLSRRTLQAI